MLTVTRPALRQLAQELTAGGVSFRALGTYDDDDGINVHTYDALGAIEDLPAGAAAVLAAHVPPPPPAVPDYGSEAPENYATQLSAAVTQLRAYLGMAAPTAAQTTGALKLVIRLALALARRAIY